VFLKLLISGNRIGSVHQGRSATHVDRHGKHLLNLLARSSELDQSFRMKTDATITMGRNTKRECDQLLRFLVQRARAGRRLR
jgi:hypothetical protein